MHTVDMGWTHIVTVAIEVELEPFTEYVWVRVDGRVGRLRPLQLVCFPGDRIGMSSHIYLQEKEKITFMLELK